MDKRYERGVIMTEQRFKFIHDENNRTIGFIDNSTERKYTKWYQLPRLINGLDNYKNELIRANQFLLKEVANLKGYESIELFLKNNPSFEDKIYNIMEEDSIDCSRCCFFDCEQDTDDWGRYIAPPVLTCEKGHKLSIEEPNEICSEFKDAWKSD